MRSCKALKTVSKGVSAQRQALAEVVLVDD